jgi:hypothetical protein
VFEYTSIITVLLDKENLFGTPFRPSGTSYDLLPVLDDSLTYRISLIQNTVDFTSPNNALCQLVDFDNGNIFATAPVIMTLFEESSAGSGPIFPQSSVDHIMDVQDLTYGDNLACQMSYRQGGIRVGSGFFDIGVNVV